MHSQTFRPLIRLLTLSATFAAIPLVASAQLKTVAISRSVEYAQDGVGSPVFTGATVESLALFEPGKAGVKAQLEKPNGLVPLSPDANNDYARSDLFQTVQAMNSGYPDGQYRFRFSGTFSGTYALTLGAFGPPAAPRFLNASEAAAINPIQGFTFRWEVGPVQSNDVVTIAIITSDGREVVSPYQLPPSTTQLSAFLPEDETLYVNVSHSRVISTNTYANNVIGMVLTTASTTLVARTKPLRDAVFEEHPVRTLTVPAYSRTRLKARVSDPNGFRLKWQWCQPGTSTWQDLGYFSNGVSTSSEELVIDNVQPTWAGLKFRLSANTDKGTLYSDESVLDLSPPYTVTQVAGSWGVISRNPPTRFEPHTAAACDRLGNSYVSSGTAVRQITPTNTVIDLAGSQGVTGLTDGERYAARFMEITDMVAAPDGTLFIVDRGGRTIRKLQGEVHVTTIAGQPGLAGLADGPASSALFNNPTKIARAVDGRLYIADTTPEGDRVLRVLTPGGKVSTQRIPGPALGEVRGLAVDSRGRIYISDGSAWVRQIHPDGNFSTIAGSVRDYCWLSGAREIVVDPFDVLYVSDGDQAVVRIEPSGRCAVLFGRFEGDFYYNGPGGVAEGCFAHLVALPNGTIGIADPKFLTFRHATPDAPPLVSITPSAVSLALDGTATLTASAPAADSSTRLQWLHDGQPIPGANAATLTIPHIQPQDAGTYTVAIAHGGLYSASAASSIAVSTPELARASGVLNLSTRAMAASGDQSLISGFVIVGAGTKRVLVRTVGPTLRSLGVVAPLADPEFTLLGRSGDGWTTIGGNDDWNGSDAATIIETSARVGAFALPDTSLDAALALDLPAGHYTVVNNAAPGTSGIALVEIYDADDASSAAHLENLSTRGWVGTGESLMIPGFVVGAPRRVLIRAVGPGLISHGVSGVLADPELTLWQAKRDGSGFELVRSNDTWSQQPGADELEQTMAAVGAFALDRDSAEAAMLVILQPGVYSAHMIGAGGSSGVGLIELYLVP